MINKSSSINQHYDNTATISEIKKTLSTDNVVQLQEFLDKESYYKLFSEIKKIKTKKDIDVFNHKYNSGHINLPKEISEFIKKIIGKNLKYKLLILEHQDYSLIHDKELEVVIDFTANWLNGWGGYLMYNDGEGNVTKIPSKENSITISNGKTFGAIKYVNNHSEKNKKIYIIGRLK